MTTRRTALLRFAVLGGLLFALERSMSSPDLESTSADRERLAELPALELEEELLFREALALGLHESDPIVARRLERNLRFVTREGGDPGEGTGGAGDALALGLHEGDLVVRRRLAQKLRLAVEAGIRAEPATELELEAYLERHARDFALPAAARLVQICVDPARHPGRAEEEAGRLRERLRADGVTPNEAVEVPGVAGDPCLVPRETPPRSQSELAKTFGADFAAAVFGLPEGSWQGPLRSTRGWHVVQVVERVPEQAADLSRVRAQVEGALVAERTDRALREKLQGLRQRAGLPPRALRSRRGATPRSASPSLRRLAPAR